MEIVRLQLRWARFNHPRGVMNFGPAIPTRREAQTTPSSRRFNELFKRQNWQSAVTLQGGAVWRRFAQPFGSAIRSNWTPFNLVGDWY